MIDIIYVSSDSHKSGVPVHILLLIKNLVNFNFKVIAPEGWMTNELEKLNIKTFKFIVNLKNILKIRNIYKSYPEAIIHCHGVKAGIVGRIAALGLKNKIIYTEHNWTKDYKIENKLRAEIQLLLLKLLSFKTSKVICVSEAVKDFYISKNIVSEKKLEVIYNAVEFFDKSKNSTDNRSHKTIVIGSIGTLVKRKGFELIIKSISLLKNQNIKLLILGEGEEKYNLIELIKILKIEYRVEFINDKIRFWENVDIYVQASQDESFGMAIIEAAGNGIPLIVSDVGAVREVTFDNAVYFKFNDIDDLVKKISLVKNNYNQYKNISLKLMNMVKNSYNIKIFAKNYKDFYSKITDTLN